MREMERKREKESGTKRGVGGGGGRKIGRVRLIDTHINRERILLVMILAVFEFDGLFIICNLYLRVAIAIAIAIAVN